MTEVKSVSQWVAERGATTAELVVKSGLDDRVVDAIVMGRYTPSPEQRSRLAAALGLGLEQITWGHIVPVEHMYGHGQQFGRSP
jgi:hypothetical protein